MALNTLSLRSSLSGYLQLFNNRTDISTETLNTHNDLIRKVDGMVEAVQTKELGIVTSKVLSNEGKSQAVAELSTASAPKFGFLERVVRQLEEDLRATKERLYTMKPPARFGTDARVQYANGLEIRQDYKRLIQNERDAAFVLATQSGDDAVIWAMLEAPVLMVTPEILDSAVCFQTRPPPPPKSNDPCNYLLRPIAAHKA